MREPLLRDDSNHIEIRGVLMRAAALHTSRVAGTRAIPDPLIRDLLIAVLLTEGGDKPSARSRLEQVLGKELTARLLNGPIAPAAPAE
jgi:hypothetical protein